MLTLSFQPPQRPMESSNSVRQAHIICPNSVVWLDDPDSPTYRSRALLLQVPILAQQPWKSPLLDGGTWEIGQGRAMCQAWDDGHGLHGTIWHGVYKRHALPKDLEYLSIHDRQSISREVRNNSSPAICIALTIWFPSPGNCSYQTCRRFRKTHS